MVNETTIHYLIYKDIGIYNYAGIDYRSKKPQPYIYKTTTPRTYFSMSSVLTYQEAEEAYKRDCINLGITPDSEIKVHDNYNNGNFATNLFFIVIISNLLGKPYILYNNSISKKTIKFIEKMVESEANVILNIKKQDKMTICEKNIYNIILRSKEPIVLKYIDYNFIKKHKLMEKGLNKVLLF